MYSIEALPENVIERIAFFLDGAGVNCLRKTCKKCRQCISPRVLRIDNKEQYEKFLRVDCAYLSTLKIDDMLLNRQEVNEITRHCKELRGLEMSVMCTLKADYDLDFDEFQHLEIMLLRFYIRDFEGVLKIKGSSALIISKVDIFSLNRKTFEIGPNNEKIFVFDYNTLETSSDEHVKRIILDFEKCMNLKS
jgi:hypothetical protein